ncbi:metallophosphoesterase [Lichenicola sp.]|uniref:metallophosphoesterase n=1 Tax=Lichenicola sp. TaxID=2804529 RepID=UPI003B00C36C
MTVFFTADTHFGHGGARGLYRRPFASTAEMDVAMLRAWNETVGLLDEVWHLGDFAVGPTPDRTALLLEGLSGIKHLVTGNNDSAGTRALPGWSTVQDYAELVIENTGLVLCHYAFRSWRNMQRGWLNLHGHSHGRLAPPMPRQFDVGVDCRGFRPVQLADLQRRSPARAGAARRTGS